MSLQPWYATRESVANALDAKSTAYAVPQIDDAIEAASRDIEQATNRIFYPQAGTRYLDWPDPQNGTSYVLWLEEHEAISVSALTSGGTVIGPSLYNLEPAAGPVFDRIELKLSGGGSFGLGNTRQRDVAVTGVFSGAPDTQAAAGALAAPITDTTGTTISVTEPAAVGVGSLLLCGTERLIVTGRAYADSTKTTTDPLTALASLTAVPVSDGTVFNPGEVIAIGTEKMRVDFILTNTLVVTRAWDGTVLGDHVDNAPVYRETAVTVERGACGSTAATHLTAAPLTAHRAPGPVRTLCRAQAIDTVLQEQGGYARSVGSGDNARNASGAALANLWDRVVEDYRRYRIGVV